MTSLLRNGYKPSGDGLFRKTVTFSSGASTATETLVRNTRGRLVHVERSKTAILQLNRRRTPTLHKSSLP